MNQFYLKILAWDHMFFKGNVTALTIPAFDGGEKGILAHHEDMVIAINGGNVRFTEENGNTRQAVVGKGFAQVVNNRVNILVDLAERPEDIDKKRARQAAEEEKEQLRQKRSIQEYHVSQSSMARALSRLKYKEKDDL